MDLLSLEIVVDDSGTHQCENSLAQLQVLTAITGHHTSQPPTHFLKFTIITKNKSIQKSSMLF
jgi:hypothetical protein